jgi:hypothetical protein
LSFLFIYLFIFYSSAIYNLLYVAKEADRASQLGFTTSISSVEFFNSQALSKILASNFSNILFCFIGVLIPLGLSITKVFNKNKVVIFILSWILAVVVVDFFVALSISKTISKVESIRSGSQDLWVFSSSFQDLEFWKVFIFGAIPLIMFKLNAELIYSKWRTSQPDLMEKQECIQLDEDIYKLNHLVESLSNKIADNNNDINAKELRLNKLNGEEHSKLVLVETHFLNLKSRVTEITSNFIADIESGNITSLKDVISARIAAFKQGFVNYITSYYAQTESQRRIELINKAQQEWNKKEF